MLKCVNMNANVSNELEQLVSIQQIREAWSISRRTIYDLFEDGTFTKIKIKGSTRIPLSEVNTYVNSQKNK
jgi:predicted DNA-binding transcriptional regulator AlpA